MLRTCSTALTMTRILKMGMKKDKGKGKVGEPPQKPTPKPPQEDTNPVGQPSSMQKATSAFEPRSPYDPRGKTVPQGQSAKVPKPKGRRNHPSDSVNQDGRTIVGYYEDSRSTISLRWRLDAKYKKYKSEKARPRGGDLRNYLSDKMRGHYLPESKTKRL
uniref:Uncharacterized protein n=1 Tax=Cannabis sativa TaxID=3483 RepID=A0A803QCC5_CANSA